MTTGEVKQYHCKRCDYKWYQKAPNTPKPQTCSRCKSPHWETEKIRKWEK